MNEELLLEIKNSIRKTVDDTKIAVAFSGGVDSTLLAKILHDMEYDVHLLTIGFHDSHDIIFAKTPETFKEVSLKIHNTINTDNLSWNENSIAFYYVSVLAKQYDLKTVVTANGIDELFCGYNLYREAIGISEDEVMKMMELKLENEKKMMIAVNNVTSEFDIKIVQPLLTNSFIEYAKKIPISEKIHSSDDLLRKHVIRKLAMDCNVPEISAQKQKKALQYGTQIHKSLLKSRKTS